MAKYPTVEIKSQWPIDSKTGGSTSFIKREPDFAKFTQDDWNRYNHEKIYKENEKLKGILSWTVVVLIICLGVLFGR